MDAKKACLLYTSVYSDIDALNALGYDIRLRRGRSGGYWMATRPFELAEDVYKRQTLDNKPGKLAEVIQVIGRFGYDMESIKSRPLPHVPFDYYFYVELGGDPSADETAALLRELDHTCRTVRLLGVYTK